MSSRRENDSAPECISPNFGRSYREKGKNPAKNNPERPGSPGLSGFYG
jgi:hypothetical protein